MKAFSLTALTLAAVASSASAQSLRDCETFEANARNLTYPYSEATRSFANGAIRFLSLDTGGEPACCSSHFMVISPDPEMTAFEVCTLVSNTGANGFAGVDLTRARSSYDATTGLTVAVPVSIYRADGTGTDPATVTVTVNQQDGTVVARSGP